MNNILCFKCSKKSFNDIDLWVKDLKKNSSPDVKVFLVGNKNDLEENRVVSTEEAKQLYNDLEMDYFIESSAKTGFNAKEIFIQAAKLLFYEYQKLLHLQENVKKEHKTKKLEMNNSIKRELSVRLSEGTDPFEWLEKHVMENFMRDILIGISTCLEKSKKYGNEINLEEGDDSMSYEKYNINVELFCFISY